MIDLGQPDVAISDTDGDGVVDGDDNCPMTANPGQADQDVDGEGDACDDDVDGDGVSNDSDNCLTVDNSGQLDTDADGQGDACDDDIDGDGLNADDEMMRGTDPYRRDTDFDGLADGEDFAHCRRSLTIGIPTETWLGTYAIRTTTAMVLSTGGIIAI